MEFMFSVRFQTRPLSRFAPNQALVLSSCLVCPADDNFGCNTETGGSDSCLFWTGWESVPRPLLALFNISAPQWSTSIPVGAPSNPALYVPLVISWYVLS